MNYPDHPDDDPEAITVSRIHYPAGRYRHPPSGRFQLRVVRGGSSYAEVDLGAGPQHVFTRPGDLIVSLGDKSTLYGIEEGRDLTFLQAGRCLADRLLRELGASLDDLAPLAVRPFRDRLVADLTGRMEETESAQVARRWTLGVMLALLLDAARRQTARSNAGRLTPRTLARVKEAVEAGLERTLTVAELTAAAGMADRAFSQAFREAVGMPVYQYVLRRRAERAVALLVSTQLPLAEIAQRVGFTHQAHMTRVLKRLKGQTPNQIRAG